METNPVVFDATNTVAVQLLGPGGRKTVRVRFPSDDEWAERQRRRKVLIKNLGRGVSETTLGNGEEVDAALLAKIRLDPDPEVDSFEAQKVPSQAGSHNQQHSACLCYAACRAIPKRAIAPRRGLPENGSQTIPKTRTKEAGRAVEHSRARGCRNLWAENAQGQTHHVGAGHPYQGRG